MDKNKNCSGKVFSDNFINESIYEPNNILKEIKRKKNDINIDGVMCLGSDSPISVSIISKKLKLETIPLEAAKISSNKVKLKKLFDKLSIKNPKYLYSKKFKDIDNFINKNELPIIIKPDDSRGSRGVSIIWKKQGLEKKFFLAKKYSTTGSVLAEEFLDGAQISSETVIYKSNSYTVGLSDRNYELISKSRSQVIENGGDLPASLSKDLKKKINNKIKIIAKALGVKNGMIKGDIIIKNNIIYIIEVALRLSGGFFSSHKIPHSTGVNLLDIAARIALKEDIKVSELKIKYNKPVSQRFLIPKNGKIKSFNHSFQKFNKNILFSNITIPNKKNVKFPKNHTERYGCVISTGKSRNSAILSAKKYIDNIKLRYH